MKYFGTDGFRGKVSEKLNASHAFAIGRYLGYYFNKQHKSKMIIGKDTRLSSDILEHALASGAASMGVDVYLLGVAPTPVVSFLIRKENYDFGAMISASHNPYTDNGIKIFNEAGFKLDAAVEEEIEAYIDAPDQSYLGFASGDAIGKIINIHDVGLDKYANWLHDICDYDFHGMHILADLANGSATAIAAQVLRSFGAEVDVMSNEPDGLNINLNCGSTHLDNLSSKMLEGSYDLGIAFDGDADRLLAVDESGNIIDGDVIMFLCASYLAKKKQLHDNTVVTTVMSNIGFHKALKEAGMKTKIVAVGDKYVAECMFKEGYSLGGEQSGHIIFGNEAVTGDGLLSAIHLLAVLQASGKTMGTLREAVTIYPQLLKNLHVHSKEDVLQDAEISTCIETISKKLGENGRILVRPSGTEELIRVMVEAVDDETCEAYVNEVIDLIKSKNM